MFRSYALQPVFIAAFLAMNMILIQCGPAGKNPASSTFESVENSDSMMSTVYVTPTGKKYHRGDCSSIRKTKTALTAGEAIEKGYQACKICRPPKP